MRIQLALLVSGIVTLAATVPVTAGAAPTPSPTPSPTGLPIGNVKVQVTQPGQQPQGASHVEQPPINR